MPIGNNAGHQLNIGLIEVGMIHQAEALQALGQDVQTVSIHPLLVAPKTWRYTDATRSTPIQTQGGAIKPSGGRALRQLTLEGTFGVETRGLGPYIGTGDVRYQRFYREVVRMGDARTREEVDENVNLLTGTPFLPLLLASYNPDSTLFFVNVFDFWHDRAFEAVVLRFDTVRQAREGGAQGLTAYTLLFQEVGPIVQGSVGDQVIGPLMNALTTWNDVNQVLLSYTADAIIGSTLGVAAIAANQAEASLGALQANLDSLLSLMGGASSPPASTSASTGSSGDPSSSTADVPALASAAADALQDLAQGLQLSFGGQLDAPVGTVDLLTAPGLAAFDAYEQLRSLDALRDAALWQPVAGKLFGMDREAFEAFAAQQDGATAPEIGGSHQHQVTELDTPSAIAGAYGVSWSRILAVNRLTPAEALEAGRILQIPRVRPRGSQGIAGLPVLGSHVGQEAWGTDFALELGAGEDGDLETVAGADCLSQGVQLLTEELGVALLSQLDSVPEEVRAAWIGQKVAALLGQDRRISGARVTQATEQPGQAGYHLEVEVRPITGTALHLGVST